MKRNKKHSKENLNKLIFYSRELLKIKLSSNRESLENEKLSKLYKDLKKTIAKLSSKVLNP